MLCLLCVCDVIFSALMSLARAVLRLDATTLGWACRIGSFASVLVWFLPNTSQWPMVVYRLWHLALHIDRLGYGNRLLSFVGLGGLVFCSMHFRLPRCCGSPTSLESCRAVSCWCCCLAVQNYCVDRRHSLAQHRSWYPSVEPSAIVRRSRSIVARNSEIHGVEGAATVRLFTTRGRVGCY
jgi:hypothetical protein